MRKQHLLKTMLLLCALIVGSSSAWADDTFVKVTSAPSDWSGDYLIVYENSSAEGYSWTGVDENNCYVAATISENVITMSGTYVSVTIESMTGGYSIKVNGGTNNGKYISGTSDSNTINFNQTAAANTLSYDSGVDIVSNTSHFVFQSTSNTKRYRYYKSSTYSGSNYHRPQLYKKESAKADNDLTITSTYPVELTLTASNLTPTSTISYTTSSTGAVTFRSDNEYVATVDNQGVITAHNGGAAVITISQAADDNYKAVEVTINVQVTDARTPIVTFDLDDELTMTVGQSYDFGDHAIVASGGEVEYSYETGDENVLKLVEGTESVFEAIEGPTQVPFIITATPTGDNASAFKPVTHEIMVNIKAVTTLALDPTAIEIPYSDDATDQVTVTVTEGYSYEDLQIESDNESVATVTIDEDIITVTAHLVGKAKVTVTAPESDYFSGEVTKTFDVTVTQPAGKTKAAGGFTKVTDTDDVTDGEYLIVYEDGQVAFDGGLTTLDAESNTIAVEIENDAIAVTDKSLAATFTIDVTNGTLQSKSGLYIGVSSNSNGLKQTENADAYTNSFSIGDDGNAVIAAVFENSTMTMKFNSASNQNRFRYYKSGQQAIQLYKLSAGGAISATLNAFGYATFCSEYPVDFTDAEGYTAWQITAIDGDAIKFEKVTGPVKGGTGLLLKGDAYADISIKSVDSTNELDDNLLVGTLAPTYVTANEYYGLSGKNFVPVNAAGTVNPGKALLPASLIPDNARQLTFVFDEEGNTTSIDVISKTEDVRSEVYNLNGQRVAQPTKGLYIVNGRKVVIK